MILPPETLPVEGLTSKRIPFIVPKYQRAFAWEHDLEVSDFVKDIDNVVKAIRSNVVRRHFFGGIVSVEHNAPNTAYGRCFELVDGQQRLTTLMITIALLCEGLSTLEVEARQKGDTDLAREADSYRLNTRNNHLYYEEVVLGKGVESRLRLKLSKVDDDFFRELISHPDHNPDSDSQRESHLRLKRAWDYIFQNLIAPKISDVSFSLRDRLDNLMQLREALFQNCEMILIKSDDRAEAYRLFAILNDRGKTLSDGDLLRSYTLEILEGHISQQDSVEKLWGEILKYKDNEIEDFLRAYYPSVVGNRAPSRDLSDAYKDQFFKLPKAGSLKPSDAQRIKKTISNMEDESQVYQDIANGIWPYATSSVQAWDRDRLNRLIKVLKHSLCIPLLLSAKSKLNESDFAELIHGLELFAFRYITITNQHAGRLGNTYNQNAKKIREDSTYKLDNLWNDLRALQINASDESFETGLKEQLTYSRSSMRLIIRHFLSTVDSYWDWYATHTSSRPSSRQPKKLHVIDLTQATIEHIYPQSAKTKDAALEPHKHSLGNLSYWSPNDNSTSGNDSFAVKKADYSKSDVSLNRILADYSSWDQAQLISRQDALIDVAKKLFRI